jgi:hypothetical protein
MVMRRFQLFIFVFILSFIFSQNLYAQFWADKTKNLKASFNQTEFNLGKIKPGQEIRLRVALKNTGDAFLQVQNITTVPESTSHKLNFIWPKGAILPEDSAAIEMIFVAADVPDSFNYKATIVFNNKYSRELTVKGLVTKQESDKKGPIIHFENNFCDLEKIQYGGRYTCVFSFMNIGDESLLIKAVKTEHNNIAVTWPKQPVLPGKKAEINAVLNAEGYGSLRRYLNVETNIKGSEPILLIIKGKLPSAR